MSEEDKLILSLELLEESACDRATVHEDKRSLLASGVRGGEGQCSSNIKNG